MDARWVQQIAGGLIVSCQPVPDGALDRDDIVLAMAQAAQASGACAVRIEGVRRVTLVAQALKIPVVGIVKRDDPASPIRITPTQADVRDLALAGAAVVAFDATNRMRPEPVAKLFAATRQYGVLAMADCANATDGLSAWALGCELVGTTLSGYTQDNLVPDDAPPDWHLITALAEKGVRVVAEGRIRTPAHAAEALRSGATCVTVGSAITRIEHITQWFVQSMREV